MWHGPSITSLRRGLLGFMMLVESNYCGKMISPDSLHRPLCLLAKLEFALEEVGSGSRDRQEIRSV
jgi:hypothetical protein